MTARPNNYYAMDYEQRREYDRNRRILEDHEDEKRTARALADRARHDLDDARRKFVNERREAQAEIDEQLIETQTKIDRLSGVIENQAATIAELLTALEEAVNSGASWNGISRARAAIAKAKGG